MSNVEKCKSAPKQSIETHSAWFLIPPANAADVDWGFFPEDTEFATPDETGFRGFIVKFYNVISDVVVQDGYQSVLNLRMVLNQISTRHKRIDRCARETDGAGSYNSVFVALFTLQLGQGGKSGSIKVVQHGHNEPGHGSDICDTAGANCIRECWRSTKRTGISIISAYRTTKCLREAEMPGFIHRQVSHDPDSKIWLPRGTKFKDVLIKSCLHKSYPIHGPYAGGIVFRRYYGVGEGIGFTKTECEEMWGGFLWTTTSCSCTAMMGLHPPTLPPPMQRPPTLPPPIERPSPPPLQRPTPLHHPSPPHLQYPTAKRSDLETAWRFGGQIWGSGTPASS